MELNTCIETTINFAHEDHVFSAYRLVYLMGFVLSAISFLVTFCCFKEVDVEELHGTY